MTPHVQVKMFPRRRRPMPWSVKMALAYALYAAALVILALMLTGCATASESKVKTEEVKIPVATSCVPKDFPPAPATYPDDGISTATDPAQRTIMRAAANAARRARLALVEPIIIGCR